MMTRNKHIKKQKIVLVIKFQITIDDYDLTGISVIDLLQNPSNKPYYNQRNSDLFANVVERILTNNNFELAIRAVKTRNDNTTLRMKNMNTDYSQNYKDAILENPQPVVLAHGIHSNLNTWQDFAEELAFDKDNARDAWLIEMYGGPTTECDTCPVYTFDDLRYYYFPALIAGVQKYSNQNNLSYVGYDLGCTVALESLENYSGGLVNAGYYFDTNDGNYKFTNLNTNPIGTFVGLGCIGNFSAARLSANGKDYIPYFINFVASNDNIYRNNNSLTRIVFKDRIPGRYHNTPVYFIDNLKAAAELFPKKLGTRFVNTLMGIPKGGIVSAVIFAQSLFEGHLPQGDSKISVEIYNYLNDIIYQDKNEVIGKNVSITNVIIIQGTEQENDCSPSLFTNDLNCFKVMETDNFIFNVDQKYICQNINSTNKYYIDFKKISHFDSKPIPLIGISLKKGLPSNKKVTNVIQNYLTTLQIKPNPKEYEIISTSSNCE